MPPWKLSTEAMLTILPLPSALGKHPPGEGLAEEKTVFRLTSMTSSQSASVSRPHRRGG